MSDASKEAKRLKAEFDALVKAASPGEEIHYHTGHVAGGPYRNAAYAAYERGDVMLVQRRVDVARFDYLAIRTRKK